MLWLCGLLNHKYKRPSIESAKERPRPIRPEAKSSKDTLREAQKLKEKQTCKERQTTFENWSSRFRSLKLFKLVLLGIGSQLCAQKFLAVRHIKCR